MSCCRACITQHVCTVCLVQLIEQSMETQAWRRAAHAPPPFVKLVAFRMGWAGQRDGAARPGAPPIRVPCGAADDHAAQGQREPGVLPARLPPRVHLLHLVGHRARGARRRWCAAPPGTSAAAALAGAVRVCKHAAPCTARQVQGATCCASRLACPPLKSCGRARVRLHAHMPALLRGRVPCPGGRATDFRQPATVHSLAANGPHVRVRAQPGTACS